MVPSVRGALLITILFGTAAFGLLGVRPLWLDELLQLRETRQPSTSRLIALLPRNAGAAPFGYLVQQETLRLTGYSVRRARLPAALFAIAAVFAVAVLASELGLNDAWIAAGLFALFPMTLRYATESRIYSQALFLSIAASLAYLRLSRLPNARRAAVYGLALAASTCTQPYSACIGIAHILWSLHLRERRTALYGAAALAGTMLAFLPWYAWSRNSWMATVAGGELHFTASWKTPLLVLRELTGGGYWCTALLLALCILAIIHRLPDDRARAFLVLGITVPLLCVFAADAMLDYFVAGRQFLWGLPALAVLAAAPIRRLKWTGVALAVLVVAVCVVADIRYFTRPSENWAVAADAIAKPVDRGACFSTAPADLNFLYEFFRPDLARAHCEAPVMLLAITPYTTAAQRTAAIAMLAAQGYRQNGEIASGGSTILLFRR